MHIIRRVGVLATAGLFLSAFIGGPAGADTPAAYTASAKGSALTVTLANQGISLGLSSAQGDSSPNAAAEGAAALLGTTFQGQQKAAAGETKPEACMSPALPAQLASIINLGLGCASAQASVDGGYANSKGTGTVGKLDVSVNTLLEGPAAPITEPLQEGLDTLFGAICEGGPELCPVVNTVQEVYQSVIGTKTLEATIGASESSVASNASKVTALSVAKAAEVIVLPEPELNVDGVDVTEPFLTITAAEASAKVECDIASGVATATTTPTLVQVKIAAPLFGSEFNPGLVQALPGNLGSIVIDQTSATVTVAPGQSIVIAAGTPLETEISVAAGKTVDNPDGTKSAIADGVKVHALRTAPAPLAGGLLLNLAHAEATAGCRPAVIDPPAPVAPPAQELPRTGGTPVIPMLGAGALLAAVVTRRTLLARSN